MRILVTGANGVLGKEVVKAAMNADDCQHLTSKDIDICNQDSVSNVLHKLRPHIVINCAGLVKYRPYPDSQYVRVNSLAPQILAERCDWFNIRLLHVSTDCVFSGKNGRAPYSEVDYPDPVDLYGRSKVAGEITRCPHLTIRTSFIGWGERGLLSWLIKQRGKITGYEDAHWNGLTASVLARTLIKLAHMNASGLLHLYATDMTKYELLSKLALALGVDVEVGYGPTPPEHRVDRRLRSITGISDLDLGIPCFDKMLDELIEQKPCM
jgi:dTDP-4-dehydrorhamnose reductase